MSLAFRKLLRKVGSGVHTGEALTRQESAAATQMMLLQEATPAQIGAFMIAHRIRRPTGEELAGMLDAYEDLGPNLSPIQTTLPLLVMGSPYDGRSRTAPISPLTALILATAGCPILQHGGDRMPTKEGEPLIDLWRGLGVDWAGLSLPMVQQILETSGLGFLHLPTHFPLAQGLVPYREQIGKRPPFATIELIWCPYLGSAHVVAGFVHPPTELMMRDASQRRGVQHLTTVKGLEGSCDLPRERTGIIGLGSDRLFLHPHEYGFAGANVPLTSTAETVNLMQSTLMGQPSEFFKSVVWNSGFYLWRCGLAASIKTGVEAVTELLNSGQALRKLHDVQQLMSGISQ
ncbi:MAG: anthranilate phosphoribosyltransferase family protein [Leptolyngbyaceae cyanobacterium]